MINFGLILTSNNLAIDIWALGVLSFVLLCGHFPFTPLDPFEGGRHKTRLLKNIVSVHVNRSPGFLSASREARDFVLRALQERPEDRLSLEDMLAHPFLVAGAELSPSCSTGESSSSPEAVEWFREERGENFETV